MDKLLFKRILVAALTVLVLVYVTYRLISANFEMYPTENAVQATVTDSIRTEGFIIRDERIINNDSNGVLSYSVSDGDNVNADSEIAKVFSTQEDAAANSQADAVDRRIETLTESQKNTLTGAVSVDVINNNIKSNLIDYLSAVNDFDVKDAMSGADKLMTSINQRQLLTGKILNFNTQISTLTAQSQNLRNSSGESKGSIKTPCAGYFTEFFDGYENAYPYSKVADMTLDEFRSIRIGTIPDKTAGKVIGNVKWYVACEVTPDQASSLNIYDGSITVLFSEASTEPIPAKLIKIQNNNDDNALVVLECNYMNRGLLEARHEPIEIGMGTFSGLRVSKRAIHDDYVTKVTYDENDKPHRERKKVQGVYVLYGSEVQFKQVAILYSTKDYVICDSSPEDKVLFNGETISLYDKVIVKGDDLYDGKVIS